MDKIKFGIIGTGWRSEFYIRIARLMPEKFIVTGILARNLEKGSLFSQKWAVTVYYDMEKFIANSNFDFVVVAVSKDSVSTLVSQLLKEKVPMLCETPPSEDLDTLIELNKLHKYTGGRIQIAEQYAFQPYNSALINVCKSGILGDISEVMLSLAHDYHGISLIRKLLNINFENAKIWGKEFSAEILKGPGRNGFPEDCKLISSNKKLAYIDFGSKLGIYDFSKEQYFSSIRSNRVLIRGSKGEIVDGHVNFMKDYLTPINFNLIRSDAGSYGNLEGLYHKGFLLGDSWVYTNPFVPSRLSDDEIAIATCLKNMKDYIDRGTEFYSLSQASQDVYLSLIINKSINESKELQTFSQIWHEFSY